MPWLSAHVRFAILAATLGLGVLPAYTAAARTAPADASSRGQVTGQVAVDCDSLPDTTHGPIVVVTAPAPGATLATDTVTIQGAALDCAADVGVGVDRVSVFLGQRDTGGLHLGEAGLREPSPIHVAPADQYSSVGWSLKTPVPLKPGQVDELYVYARSDLNSIETVVAVPVRGGETVDGASTTPSAPIPTSVPISDAIQLPAVVQPESGLGDIPVAPTDELPTE